MEKTKNILIVDDEKDILELIKFNISNNGYKCFCAEDGEVAVKLAKNKIPDLIILDLMLPGIDGLDVCRILKNNKETKNIPILMLTAKTSDENIIEGLEAGADDYVTKPFSIKVLIARVENLLRRNYNLKRENSNVLSYENLKIHIGERTVSVNKKNIDLTYMEFQILYELASHPNWVYTRAQLIDKIRGDDYPVTDRSIDFQIVGLRKKLGEAKKYIKTVRSVGYRFLDESLS
tara:strand:+ start:831 stop:1532 length:702 start_codon:yes stop_codon:yes gene_type:complete